MSDNVFPESPDRGGTGINGPDGRPLFFNEPGMDRFVAVILNMASEMWAMEERLRVLEGRASDKDPADEARKFVQNIFEPLREPRERG